MPIRLSRPYVIVFPYNVLSIISNVMGAYIDNRQDFTMQYYNNKWLQ